MDDRVDDRSFASLAARVATLPPHEELLQRIAQRERQHLEFMARADRWEAARTGVVPGVVFPRDEAALLALGVPCDDCLVLVYAQGAYGHVVRFGFAPGRHWAALISAHCGRRFVLGATEELAAAAGPSIVDIAGGSTAAERDWTDL